MIPARFRPFMQVAKADAGYETRTAYNVADADATLVLHGPRGVDPDGGTALTMRFAREQEKPCLVLPIMGDLDRRMRALTQLEAWLNARRPRVLNVAGPRESRCSGIEAAAYAFLLMAWSGTAPAGFNFETL